MLREVNSIPQICDASLAIHLKYDFFFFRYSTKNHIKLGKNRMLKYKPYYRLCKIRSI